MTAFPDVGMSFLPVSPAVYRRKWATTVFDSLAGGPDCSNGWEKVDALLRPLPAAAGGVVRRGPRNARGPMTGADVIGPTSRFTPLRTSNFWKFVYFAEMIIGGTALVESYFANHAGHKGIKAVRS
jgi:hypothetical protein